MKKNRLHQAVLDFTNRTVVLYNRYKHTFMDITIPEMNPAPFLQVAGILCRNKAAGYNTAGCLLAKLSIAVARTAPGEGR